MFHEIWLTTQFDNNNDSKKGVWVTDLHLDAAEKDSHRRLVDTIRAHEPDFLLIGGDISNGVASLVRLKHLAKLLNIKCYFVLGNHDYYYGSIRAIRKMASQINQEYDLMQYLTNAGVFELTSTTALIGHDGWADGRSGDFLKSDVILNDYLLIDELKDITLEQRHQAIMELGTEAADAVGRTLKEALANYPRVVVLTHTPPFRESCRYGGNIADDSWAPHFVCKAMGDVLLEAAQKNPENEILVLCGHSHATAEIYPVPNLHVITGHSELGNPQVQGVLHIE